MIFEDELGQLSAEEITVYDYILRQFIGSTSFMGENLMIGTWDHFKIQQIYGGKFLLTHSIIPFIKMVSFKCSVCASGDKIFELQSIIQK